MSFNANITKQLVAGIEFKDPKLKDALNKIIDGLDANYRLAEINEATKLEDFRQGFWKPLDNSGAGLAFTYTFLSRFVILGPFVSISGDLTFPVTASGAAVSLSGLPAPNSMIQTSFQPGFTDFGATFFGVIQAGATIITPFLTLAGAGITNAMFSGKTIRFRTFYYLD